MGLVCRNSCKLGICRNGHVASVVHECNGFGAGNQSRKRYITVDSIVCKLQGASPSSLGLHTVVAVAGA